jgi:hypothetical protein
MTKVLDDAIAEVARLPESDREAIGRELLAHVEKLRALRADLATGLRSLDRGEGGELDVNRVIGRARREHGDP